MATYPGSSNADTYSGTSSADTINGLAGGDKLSGLGGDDTIIGGSGDDKIYGGDGNDILNDDNGSGFAINDPPSDNDLIDGGAGNDVIYSYQGNHFQDIDVIRGGSGNDLIAISGAQTSDMADGGADIDTLYLRLAGSESVRAVFNAAQFTVQVGGVNTLSASNFEIFKMFGGSASDFLVGGDRNDEISSEGYTTGPEVLDGAGGDDDITMDLRNGSNTGGTVTVRGGSGTDVLNWFARETDAAVMNFNAAAGSYTIGGKSIGSVTGIEIFGIYAGLGDDQLTGSDKGDVLAGGGGSDVLNGGSGRDELGGGEGTDTINGGDGNDSLFGYSGFFLTSGSDTFSGGAGNDRIFGNSGIDRMDGGSGNDVIWVAGNDIVNGGGGNDTIITTNTQINMADFTSIEHVVIDNKIATITGSTNAEKIEQDGFQQLDASAGGGNDNVIGGAGSDFLHGQTGDDTIAGWNGNDSMSGDGGADKLDGGENSDALDGGAGVDRLFGGGGDDTLLGGSGNDNIHGDSLDLTGVVGFGSGRLIKPAGANDSKKPLNISNAFALKADKTVAASKVLPHVTVDATLTKSNGADSDYYQLDIKKAGAKLNVDVDREGISGTLNTIVEVRHADGSLIQSIYVPGIDAGSKIGDGHFQAVMPDAGRYIVRIFDSSGGTSRKYKAHFSIGVAGGDDVLDGGAGNDTLNGQRGNDIASFDSATKGVTVSLLANGAQDTKGAGTDTLISIEGLKGSKFGDKLTGNYKNNVLEGGKGDDTLNGGAGVDTASYASASKGVTVSLLKTSTQNTVGAGNDTLKGFENLKGSEFGDKLTGNSSTNALEGAGGADTLTGGLGSDTFLFNIAESTPDKITDFKHNTDKITLNSLSFNWFTSKGSLAKDSFHQVSAATDAAALLLKDSTDQIIYNSKTGSLIYVTGFSQVFNFAVLDKGLTLSADDFLVI